MDILQIFDVVNGVNLLAVIIISGIVVINLSGLFIPKVNNYLMNISKNKYINDSLREKIYFFKTVNSCITVFFIGYIFLLYLTGNDGVMGIKSSVMNYYFANTVKYFLIVLLIIFASEFTMEKCKMYMRLYNIEPKFQSKEINEYITKFNNLCKNMNDLNQSLSKVQVNLTDEKLSEIKSINNICQSIFECVEMYTKKISNINADFCSKYIAMFETISKKGVKAAEAGLQNIEKLEKDIAAMANFEAAGSELITEIEDKAVFLKSIKERENTELPDDFKNSLQSLSSVFKPLNNINDELITRFNQSYINLLENYNYEIVDIQDKIISRFKSEKAIIDNVDNIFTELNNKAIVSLNKNAENIKSVCEKNIEFLELIQKLTKATK